MRYGYMHLTRLVFKMFEFLRARMNLADMRSSVLAPHICFAARVLAILQSGIQNKFDKLNIGVRNTYGGLFAWSRNYRKTLTL